MKGKTEPRIFTPPLRELNENTSMGFLIIEYAKKTMGEELVPWQEWALIHMFEIVGDFGGEWHFRFRTVLILVARQNGKTVLSKIIVSFFMNVLCVKKVFGTSLSLDKAEEVWEAVVDSQQTIPDLHGDVEKVVRVNGAKRLILTENRIYRVSAPTRRAGRGDDNDLVMLDEVREQRNWDTWSASAPSINARPNGIVICFTNAGDPDSVVLRHLRSTGIAGIDGSTARDYGGEVDSETLCLLEWSAPEGADKRDLEALAQANPSLGYGFLTERALLSLVDTMPDNTFRSEIMCQQVETILKQPFPEGAWDAGVEESSSIAADSEIFYGIDLSEERRWCTIAACGKREDGHYHIEVIARRSGTEWAVDWFRSRAMRGKMKLAFQSRGAPVSGLAEQICTIKGVERIAMEGAYLTNGWARFWDAVAAGAPVKPGETGRGGARVYHLPQPVLDTPAKTCQMKKMGSGLELPDRSKSPDDIAPLFACAAAFAAATMPQKENKVYESAYASGAALVFV